jgi:hypothetical protein
VSTEHPDIFSRLAAPFEGSDVKVRTQAGRQMHYITARTAMNRLDDVLGPENWWDEYVPGENSVLCKLTVLLPGSRTLTKCDAGGYAGMADQGDDDKSGFSDAFKRAAVKFGVARYLYRDGVPDYVHDRPAQPEERSASDKLSLAPKEEGPRPPARAPAPPQQQQRSWRLPPPGKAVYAWAKGMEEHFQVSLIPDMRDTGERLGYGTNFVAWDAAQADRVTKQVALFLSRLDNYKGEFNGVVDLEAVAAQVDKESEADRLAGGLQTEADRRAALDRVSAKSTGSSGERGEVLQGSLYSCRDVTWLRSMLAVAKAELASAGVPGIRVGVDEVPEDDDEDIF